MKKWKGLFLIAIAALCIVVALLKSVQVWSENNDKSIESTVRGAMTTQVEELGHDASHKGNQQDTKSKNSLTRNSTKPMSRLIPESEIYLDLEVVLVEYDPSYVPTKGEWAYVERLGSESEHFQVEGVGPREVVLAIPESTGSKIQGGDVFVFLGNGNVEQDAEPQIRPRWRVGD